MKVYVAGKWDQKACVRNVVSKLESYGHTITYRWFDIEHDNDCATDLRRTYADADIEGVRTADAVVLLMDDPAYAYRGTFTELGAALALDKPVHLYNPHGQEAACTTNVFYWATGITHHGALDALLKEFA